MENAFLVRDWRGRSYLVSAPPADRRRMFTLAWLSMLAIAPMQYGYAAAVPAFLAEGRTLDTALLPLAVWIACQSLAALLLRPHASVPTLHATTTALRRDPGIRGDPCGMTADDPRAGSDDQVRSPGRRWVVEGEPGASDDRGALGVDGRESEGGEDRRQTADARSTPTVDEPGAWSDEAWRHGTGIHASPVQGTGQPEARGNEARRHRTDTHASPTQGTSLTQGTDGPKARGNEARRHATGVDATTTAAADRLEARGSKALEHRSDTDAGPIPPASEPRARGSEAWGHATSIGTEATPAADAPRARGGEGRRQGTGIGARTSPAPGERKVRGGRGWPEGTTGIGVKPALAVGAVLSGLGLATVALSDELWVLLVGFSILGGLGGGLVYGACSHLVASWYPERAAARVGYVTGAFGYGALPLVALLGVALWAGDVDLASWTDGSPSEMAGAVGSEVLGPGAVGVGAMGPGATGSGASGALESGVMESGVMGSSALESGVMGSGALGSGVMGSGVMGSGAVESWIGGVLGAGFGVCAAVALIAIGLAAHLVRVPPYRWWPDTVDPRERALDAVILRRTPPAVREFTLGQAVRTPALRVLASILLCAGTISIFNVVAVGTSGSWPALAVLIGLNGVGRACAMRVSEVMGRRRALALTMAVLGIGQMLLAADAVILGAVVAGAAGGAFYPLVAALVREFFGEGQVREIHEVVYSAKAVAGVVGVALAGTLLSGTAAAGLGGPFAGTGWFVAMGGAASVAAMASLGLRVPGRPATIPV